MKKVLKFLITRNGILLLGIPILIITALYYPDVPREVPWAIFVVAVILGALFKEINKED